ncbi:C25 family cysteine peptidase [Hymenobacter bucti]|uniref:C25 family cysteine peptidase n=1 Tax=Hymenobacter bucti TaxID=1844114 RepID=A0ABW4QZS4_9BACT
MTQQYTAGWHPTTARQSLSKTLLVLLALLLSVGAHAQSGAYGNEWIVAGQPYYKLKVWRDGIYRLDYNYLRSLNAAGVAPTQFQLWRRGKEVALYQGGNATALDATSYLEFYGQRNDGKLDREFYKNAADQAHQYYSFYTDTAAYFITWGSRAGKRVEQPTAAGGTPHAWRLQTSLKLVVNGYVQGPTEGTAHMPWLESSEGFFSGTTGDYSVRTDSLLRAIATQAGAPAIRAEVCLVGGSVPSNNGGTAGLHTASVRVVPPGGAPRELGVLRFQNYNPVRGGYAIQSSEVNNGMVEVRCTALGQRTGSPYDVWRYAYLRVTAPQQSVWLSDRRQLWFQNDSLLTGAATYELDNVPATVVGYDIQDPWNVQRVAPVAAQTMGSTARRFVFPNASAQSTHRLLLADANAWLVPAAAARVTFRTFDPAKPNFVIITHPQLMRAAGDVPNVARAYADYRASVAGGRYDTLMVTAPQLYDQFHYGERSVMALRHFALWLVGSSPATQVKYLLLLGKGLGPGTQPGQTYVLNGGGIVAANTSRILGEQGLDLVPTSTASTSDNFLSSDWPNNNFAARMPTGRVPATTPQEAANYLAKLKQHEERLLTYNAADPQLWRKNVLHLAGGATDDEFKEFRGYLDGYARRVPRPLLGGKVTTYQKNTTNQFIVPLNISTELNTGLAAITYFGHGALDYFNLDIGNIDDASNGYQNVGRYPVMMYNGCIAGDFAFNTHIFGVSWLLAPQKGSIGMLSQACESYAYLIDPVQDKLYELLFNNPTWFGQPVAQVYNEMVRQMQGRSAYQSAVGQEQLLSTTWQGDPALRLYAPAKPDFIASNATLSLAPAAGVSVITPTTPFVLKVGVSNPARITTDPVEIRVTRTYRPGGGRTAEVLTQTFRQAWARDTTYTFALSNVGDVYGDNTFKVELDYANKVAELDETNNTATITYSFLKGGITLVTPTEFAIVSTNRPLLVAQNNDAAAAARGYDFQVDTVATFNSGALRQAINLSGPAVVSWQPPALVGARPDSVVWYWRVRFNQAAAGEDASWQQSSFRVIAGAVAGGWSQSHHAQFQRDQLQTVAVAAPAGRWNFADQQQAITLLTVGGGGVGAGSTFNIGNGYGIRTNATVPPYLGDCGTDSPNLLLVALDGRTLKRVAVPGGPYTTCGLGDQLFYHFGSTSSDTLDNLNNSAARQQQLVTFLTNVPEGAYVALISMNRLRYAAFPAAVRTALTRLLGSQLAASGQLRNGEPWALLAKKFAAGGTLVREQGPDRTLGQASYSQLVSFVETVSAPGQAGTVLSTRIGPATEWQALFNVIKRETATSAYTLRVLGVDAANVTTELAPDVKTKSYSLASVPAAKYPYLQLEVTLRDSVNRVPPQLRQWLVAYRGLPEGTVRRDLVASSNYDPATLAAQAANNGTIKFPVVFQNIGGIDFGAPLVTRIDLLNASGVSVKSATFTAPSTLKAGESMTVQVSLDVVGIFGTLTPVVTVNPVTNRQPELYFFNNTLTLAPYTVGDTNVPPTLDVAVDGRHLLSGDLVSPTPVISIQLKDEDKLRHIKDASAFTVLLQKPGQATATLVNTTGNPEIQFTTDSTSQAGTVARLDYQPGKGTPLAKGIYTLQVQGRDRASNSAGTQTYQIKFEVVTESTITNVFPYPNPVTSKARFVFTVTGQELPRDMKIQIMTLTGKVVREIFMSELGPLHIGNNITDYAWDGTDQYGDHLANGTYLYRVSLNDPSGKFTQRSTAGDQAFKKDWGKLVLLR